MGNRLLDLLSRYKVVLYFHCNYLPTESLDALRRLRADQNDFKVHLSQNSLLFNKLINEEFSLLKESEAKVLKRILSGPGLVLLGRDLVKASKFASEMSSIENSLLLLGGVFDKKSILTKSFMTSLNQYENELSVFGDLVSTLNYSGVSVTSNTLNLYVRLSALLYSRELKLKSSKSEVN
uniref:Ribosomal protein L10 n=1 Tax=Ophirina amphinema TaxID=2108040 RepID=A0A348AYP9_9EUKA|nr:ribosomal protein L10 [Ophirina amphinema]